jgi:hypothetical protein
MKIIYRVMLNEWYENKPDLHQGIQDYDDAESAITESARLNALVKEPENIQYYVRAMDFWNH